MKYDIESKLNTVKTQIDDIAMTETEKNTMWRKIEMGMDVKAVSFLGSLRTRMRASIAFTLAVLIAGSSVAFAYADSAQPGDVLFPLGVARERVEIFLAPESKKNDLRMKFAEKRIEDGQVFLTLLVKAKGTYAVSYASTTATSTNTVTVASTTATTTAHSTVTEDATRRFNATISYLRNLQAELLKNGNTVASSALQNAIDTMITQAQAVPSDSSVLVKVNDNANKFKMDVRITNSTSTTRIAISEKTKEQENGKSGKGHNDGNNDRIGTTTTITKETFFSKIFHKKEEKKEKHDGRDDEDEDEDGDEHERFFGRFGKKITVCHISDGHKKTISIGKSAVQAHLRHGDILGKCDGNGTATTTPDMTAPIISNITATPTQTTASIAWDTNESASYKFWYGTSSPLVFTRTPDKTGAENTHQSTTLSGLVSDTTYYYVVTATDASGNTSTSTEHSFKTTVIPDTIAPTIATLATTAITFGSATVSWTTNESATGKIRYATTSPLSNVLDKNTPIDIGVFLFVYYDYA